MTLASSVVEQASLSLTWLQTPKTGFLMTWLILKSRKCHHLDHEWYIWAASWQNQQNYLCAMRRLRSAWALPSLISLRYLQEESSGPSLPIERTAKTLIRLGRCPGWSESSLGVQSIILVLSWGGSFLGKLFKMYWCEYERGVGSMRECLHLSTCMGVCLWLCMYVLKKYNFSERILLNLLFICSDGIFMKSHLMWNKGLRWSMLLICFQTWFLAQLRGELIV